MPSPILHTAAGYVIYRLSKKGLPTSPVPFLNFLPVSLCFAVVVSLLPDIDSILGVISGDFGRFHNNLTHSLITGFFVSLDIAFFVWHWKHGRFSAWFWMLLLSYEGHVIMDFFTLGRGVMLLWPFSDTRFSSPVKLFLGLHWSGGWRSTQHLWTIVTELGSILIIGLIFLFWKRRRGRSFGLAIKFMGRILFL